MIAGPVAPRTREGLWELIESHLDDVERGLALFDHEIEVEPGCTIDAMGRDAAGRPVFVFALDPDGEREFAARILVARAWMPEGLEMLAQQLPRPGVHYDLPPRTLAFGYDFPPAILAELAELPAGSVEVVQLRPFRVGGRMLMGTRVLLGAARTDEASFHPPSGLPASADTAVCTHFLRLLERLEPSFEITGDRYSRRFSHDGSLVAELQWADGGLQVRVPGTSQDGGDTAEIELTLESRQDSSDAVDRIARRYLGLLESDQTPAAPEQPAGERDAAEPPFSFDSLRRSVTETQELTEEEYSVLGLGTLDED